MFNRIRHSAMRVVVAAPVVAVAALAVAGAHAADPTTVTEMAQAIDTSDVRTGIFIAGGTLITVALAVFGVRRLVGMFTR
jgi:hypothetical protein